MAQLGNMGGSALVEGSTSFEPFPAGVYEMEVTASDVVATKSGSGQMLKLEMTVTGGDFAGRKVWHNVNIQNQSAQAQEIGQRQLSDLCRACGMAVVPSESEEFHGIPIRVSVVIENDPQYGAKNIVKRFLSDGDAAPAPAQPRQQQARPTAAPAASNGRPAPSWKRSA